MKNVSLYRKWRPQRLEDVVGQRHVTETLSNAVNGGRLVHAYLFAGPRGTGKTSTARILAKAINCEKGPTATPCNECAACVSISDGTALDVQEIDAASNRKIDEIRDLLDKIPYLPTSMRSKVYIIDEVHQLTTEASSALLKTLEEPPDHIFFVLATTEPHKLLPTIVSRCQRFDFSLVDTEMISELLLKIAATEEIDIGQDAVSMIAEQAQGSVRDAIGVIDQIANLTDERITVEKVAELLGDVEPELVFEMIDIIAERDTPAALGMVARMMESGKDPRRFVEALISQLRNLFLIQNAMRADEVVRVTADHFNRLASQADKIRSSDVLKLIERMGDVHREMRWSENPRLELECTLVKALRLETDISLEGLVYRVEELEGKVGRLSEGGAITAGKGSNEATNKTGEPPAAVSGGDSPPKSKASRRKEEKSTSPVEPKKVREEAVQPPAEESPVSVEAEATSSAAVDNQAGRDPAKAKRAWMALLSEFKNKGEMRLYALLTKAKVEEVKDGKLVLAFPKEAAFQVAAIEKGDDLKHVEQAWATLVGEPVKIQITEDSVRRRQGRGKPEAGTKEKKEQKVKPGLTGDLSSGKNPEDSIEKEQDDERPEGENNQAAERKEDKNDENEKKPDKNDPKAIARFLQESFDGKIISEDEEGKE